MRALHPTFNQGSKFKSQPQSYLPLYNEFPCDSLTTAYQAGRGEHGQCCEARAWICQETLASNQRKTGLLPAIHIEALSGLRSKDLNMARLLSQNTHSNVHFTENILLAVWIETGIYLPGRMIPSYFCWNQRMASSLLILCLAPMQPVLRFLSAMLKPGLPSTT